MKPYQKLSLNDFKEKIKRLSKKHPNFAADEVFAYKMVQIAHYLIQAQLERQMTKHNLPGEAWMVLMMVYNSEKEQIISSQVCESLGSNKSTMTRLVDSLIEQEFLIREYDVLDRRKIFLKITPSGRKMIKENIEIHAQFMKKAWQNVNMQIVSQNLEQLLNNLEKLDNEEKIKTNTKDK